MTDTETAPAAENTADEQKKPETKRETIQVSYKFTPEERVAIAEKWNEGCANFEDVEAQLASAKADYKSRLDRIELENNQLRRKFSDGFEMRATPCIVTFNDPTDGRKTYTNAETGAVVREEAMAACDYERELPLIGEEPAKAPAEPEHDKDAILEMAGAEEAGLTGDEATSAVSNPGAEDAGQTAIGEVLDAATAKTEQPLVELDLDIPGWTAAGLLLSFKMAAKQAGWPVTATKLITDSLKGVTEATTVKAKLAPHCKAPESEA